MSAYQEMRDRQLVSLGESASRFTLVVRERSELACILSGVGEGIFFAGLKHVSIKVIASYAEDQIITSDPSQLLAIEKQRRNEGG